MTRTFLPIALFVLGLFIVSSYGVDAAQTLSSRLSGRILLQTEQNGESWYVNPADQKRYYLADLGAYDLFRKVGIGISNANLSKILIADMNISDPRGEYDSDGDGLLDSVETSLHTNLFSRDTDGDGYKDKEEILNGYDPLSSGRLPLDQNFARAHAGKIFLQVQNRGEAWYINPVDLKRYYLGNINVAANVMRALGLGITDKNLDQIPVGNLLVSKNVTPKDGADTFYIRIHNVDDTAKALVNGNQIAMTLFGGDTGFVDITKLFPSGDNTIQFIAHNGEGGYTWGFQIKKNDSILFSESAGVSGSLGANNNDITKMNQNVYDKTITMNEVKILNITGYQATPPSPASPTTSPVILPPQQRLGCSTYDCFITALERNILPLGSLYSSVEFFGAIFESDSFVEIKREGNNYIQENTPRRVTMVLTEESRQSFLTAGKTVAEIATFEEEANKDIQSDLGTITVCTYPTKENVLRSLHLSKEGAISVGLTTEGDSTILDPDTRAELGRCAFKEK